MVGSALLLGVKTVCWCEDGLGEQAHDRQHVIAVQALLRTEFACACLSVEDRTLEYNNTNKAIGPSAAAKQDLSLIHI